MTNDDEKFAKMGEVAKSILASQDEESRATLIAKTQATIFGLRQVFEEQDLEDTVLAKVAQIVLINLTGIANRGVMDVSSAIESSIDAYMLAISVLTGAFEIPEAPEELIEAIKQASDQLYGPEELTDDDLKGTGLYL
jgi:hypothetical protein